jgi:hypothetical protein
MEEKLVQRARVLFEDATALPPPLSIPADWSDDLPDGVTGCFSRSRRLIMLNRHCSETCRRPERVLVHEFAHAVHWDANGYADVCDAEIEQFAVCAELLSQVTTYGRVKWRYAAWDKELRAYKEAERWFERHTPEQVKAWMQYVLCF